MKRAPLLCLSVGIGLIVALTGSTWWFGRGFIKECRDFSEAVVQIGSLQWRAAIADSAFERQHGLMHCASLPADAAMVFVFAEPGRPGFWMKDTVVSLDLIWVANGRVIGVTRGVEPMEAEQTAGDLVIYRPPGEVTEVVEVLAGRAQGVAAGDSVTMRR